MSNKEKNDKYEFYRNMRKTPWQKLFPHWWAENDLLLNAIGDEVERVKALAIFSLLNAGIKPPVMTWKESIVHKEYHVASNITELGSFITIQAPLYKTWGKITLTNNSKDEIDTLKIMINENDGLFINQIIQENDKIVFDLTRQELIINDKFINIDNINGGIPYFKTVQNKIEYDEDTPLHNEVIKIQIASKENIQCDINVDIQLDNVVFTDEQNIEITGLELVPIDYVDVYANYDFPYNPEYNGWHKIFQKKYDKNTNVLYDMLTIQAYTKEWYVEVFFKGLQYPYKVGFPCYKDAESDSMYHVNNRLDSWGNQLGLLRRNYRTNIDEEDYATTYPSYYPYDIEQDYWYYKRLTHEYAWNDLAINDVDIKDTEGNSVIQLHSINPFIEDFVVHAKSTYPTDKAFQDSNEYIPVVVSQEGSANKRTNQQVNYSEIKNLLTYNDKTTSITLLPKTGNNINELKYQSKELWTYFDLSDLPEDINIDNIEILVEGSSTDNKTDKYSNDNTGLVIPNLYEDNITFIPLHADKSYQLSKETITYSSNNLSTYLKELQDYSDEHIEQKSIIGIFKGEVGKEVHIPFEAYENDELIDDITDVWVYFDNIVVNAQYKDGYIDVTIPNTEMGKNIIFIVKSKTHKPLTVTIDTAKIGTKQYELDKDGNYVYIPVKDETGNYIKDDSGEIVKEKKIVKTTHYISGPLVDGSISKVQIEDEWHTKDVRNIIQKQGIYFCNIFENENAQSSTTINIQNIMLKVSYSDKKSTFEIETSINYDVEEPKIGEYQVTIKNTGQKPLSTNIDVISAPNIQLSQNYFKVNLQLNQEETFYADIYPQFPIDDGYYDILTVCEGFTKKDTVPMSTIGMVETGIKLLPQHAKYTETATVTAEIITADGEDINSENIDFYINNYYVNGNLTIKNNIATLTFIPKEYDFIDTGLQKIEARFGGTEKYSGSKAVNEIFIRKESTIIEFENTKENIQYLDKYDITVNVSYKDANGNKLPVDDGIVSFYANNILLGKSDLLGRIDGRAGIFQLSINQLNLEPGKYVLWARYSDSDTYASDEQFQNIRVFGGATNINVFDINASPVDIITIKATVKDLLLEPVEIGVATLNVYYGDTYIIKDESVNIERGLIEYDYDLNEFDFGTPNNNTIKANIDISFGEDIGFTQTSGRGTLTIARKNVGIEVADVFNCTQYEPLGFLVKVYDLNTNKPVTNGKVSVVIPKQTNIFGEANVDEDGYARIVCNPMVSVEEWDTTGKFEFVLGTEYPYLYKDGNPINILEKYPELSEEIEDDKDLWVFSEDINNISQYFTVDTDPTSSTYGMLLYYPNEEEPIGENVENFFFIDPDTKELYRRSSSKIRLYQVGTYNIKFYYTDSKEYQTKEKTCEKGLSITQSNTDLDLHTYLLDYDKAHNIICYVDSYDIDDNIEKDDEIVFYIDDEELLTSNIENNQAIIPYSKLPEIKFGNHLIKAEYVSDDDTCYTYALLTLNKITPLLEYNLHSQIKGEESTIDVTISNKSNKVVSGFVNLYLDGELVSYQYLYGNEGYYGVINDIPPYTAEDIAIPNFDNTVSLTFSLIMPDDIDTNYEHYIEIEYEGNDLIDYIKSDKIPLKQTQLATRLNVPQTYIARGQKNIIDVSVETVGDYHAVNEGYIEILNGEPTPDNDNVVARAPVYDSKATVIWTPDNDEITNYYIWYHGTPNYANTTEQLLQNANIILINPQSHIYVSNQIEEDMEFTENIYSSLKDAIQCIEPNGTIEILNSEYNVDVSLNIDKPLTITGQYNVIINLQKDLNINDNVLLDNVTIQSNDNHGIINRGNLKIIHSILENNTFITSTNNLIINRSLVYCPIDATKYDLNNNWWGQNDSPYPVDSHIILTLEADETPAVICNNIDIIAKMISTNGREYDIPEASFTLGADTGYFSIDNGKMINHTVNTTYFDATEEGNIYLTVDNQTIEYTIYDYDRKTEVILEPITEIPIGHYVTFTANVYSITDEYNTFSDIEGYIDFYFDNKRIGRCDVVDNQAQVSTYIKQGISDYSLGEHEIKAKYIPTQYYFSSSQTNNINIIETNNVHYVSSDGSDDNNGTFILPFKTIQKAIDSSVSGDKIFLMDKEYTETNININKNITIQSYGNNAVFKDIEESNCIFNVTAVPEINRCVQINKINFISNHINSLIINQGQVFMEQCLFYENDNIISDESEGATTIQYSAVIKQNIGNETYKRCWFGGNTPENAEESIIMEAKASKDVLYKGVIALIEGSINKYEDANGIIYLVDKQIPLRIAEFSSEQASLRPLKDYTYNNYATSLLNTNIESNSSKYKITVLNKEFYVNDNIDIRCHVQNAITDDNQRGVLNIIIKSSNVIYNENVDIDENGIAILSIPPLKLKKYDIICNYDDGQSITSIQDTIIIKKHDIDAIITFNNDKYNRIINFDAIFSATDNEDINNEEIDIYIDDNKVDSTIIENNQIVGKRIEYEPLESQIHTFKLCNNKNSKYDNFEYTQAFFTDKLDVEIKFDYDRIQKGVENTFIVTVCEDDIHTVTSGKITILFDNEVIVQDKTLINGICSFDLKIDEKGQYPVFIYYNDVNGCYNDSTISSVVNVDIFPVTLANLPETIEVDIGKTVLFKKDVVDTSYHPVLKGYFNIYVDDIFIGKANLTIGQLTYELHLPNRINAGEHVLKFEYIDETDTYLDTDIYRTLIVKKIKTSIELGNNILYPNQEGYIPFTIKSNYGTVNTGTLKLKVDDEYGNEKVYTTLVSNNLIHQIGFITPNKPAGQYPLIAEYYDDSGNYENSTLNTTININKNDVIITPNYTTYYPQKEFIFTATITNQNNKRIDNGYVDIYIDNVREAENINVKNGVISNRIIFNTAKTYKIDIIYYDDDGYYNETSYSYDFVVDKMDIEDINYTFDAENKKITEIAFDTLDDYNVDDGILYLYIDGVQMQAYNIAESHKYIDLDVQFLKRGQHTIGFNYANSFIFNDYYKEKSIEIESLETEINFDKNEIYTENSNEINISGTINTDGIVKFYITKNEEEEYKFIGLTNAKNNTFSLKYQLSPSIISGEYRLKAEFSGNDYYGEASTDECILTVIQQEKPIFVSSYDMAEYQGNLLITISTEIPNALINLKLAKTIIDDQEEEITKIIEDIDTLIVNGTEEVTYKLKDNLIGEYKIIAEYEGSPIYKKAKDECSFTIVPYQPFINDDPLIIGIGSYPLMTNEVYYGENIIHTGTIKYYFDNKEESNNASEAQNVFTFDAGTKGKIEKPIMENTIIKAKYISEDTNKILDSECTDIEINVFKNNIYLDIIEAPQYISYDEPFEIKIKASSESSLPIDVNISANYQDGEVRRDENNNFIIPCQVLTEQNEYQIEISTQENDYFESGYIHYTARLNEMNYVTISDNEITNTNVQTLSDAITLIKDNGIVDIKKAITEENITINKNVTINGNGNNIQANIINNADSIIENAIFENSHIDNKGKMEINECEFTANTHAIISNNNSIEINNCIFENNNTNSESCIEISSPNIHTVINNCSFTNNNASGNATCINSNRVNELEISNTKFINNKNINSYGSCIYAYGNSAFYKNIFYGNDVYYEIRIIKGEIIADKNIFDGINIPMQFENNSYGDLDLNYWGNIDSREDIQIPENIEINNWLKGTLDKNGTIVTPHITQYVNTLEAEITDIDIQYDSFEVIE